MKKLFAIIFTSLIALAFASPVMADTEPTLRLTQPSGGEVRLCVGQSYTVEFEEDSQLGTSEYHTAFENNTGNLSCSKSSETTFTVTANAVGDNRIDFLIRDAVGNQVGEAVQVRFIVSSGTPVKNICAKLEAPVCGQKVNATTCTFTADPANSVKVEEEHWEKYPLGADSDSSTEIKDSDEVFQSGYGYFYYVSFKSKESYQTTSYTKCTFNGEDLELNVSRGSFTTQTGITPLAVAPSIVKATAGTTSAKYTWSKVTGAKYYKVFFSKCGKSKCKAVKKTTARTFTKKGLKAKTSYKAYVVAYNAKGKKILKSPAIHIMTKGGNYSNATKVTAKTKLTVKAGKTAKLGAKIAKKDSKKKLVNHCAALRYYSADKTIAKVSKKGVVTGVKAGTTYVYAVAPSGVSAKCKVTVKTEMVTVTFTATGGDVTFTDDKEKLTAKNTISVPKGCTTDISSGNNQAKIYFIVDGEDYAVVTATGEGFLFWSKSIGDITKDQTISILVTPLGE